MKIHLSHAETTVLSDFLDGQDMFDYARFCEEMDTVFGHRGLERDPDHKMADPLHGTRSLRPWGVKPISDSQKARLDGVLRECARQTQIRGLIPKLSFKPWDKTGWGYVARPAFIREVMGLYKKLSPGDADLLATAFATEDDADVNYRAFHTTVSPDSVVPDSADDAVALAASSRGLGQSVSALPGSAAFRGEADAQIVLDALIRQGATRRVRPSQFFLDFDPLRKGFITQQQFMRGMRNANFDFTGLGTGAMEAVTAMFFDPGLDAVHYPSFCEELEKAFTVKGLERNPSGTTDTRARTVAAQPLRVQRVLNGSEEAQVQALLRDMSYRVRSRRIELVNMFKDFDRSNEEHVSEGRFLRVLASLRLVPPDPRVQQLLVRKFRGQGAKNTQVCWRAFKDTVDPGDAALGNIITADGPSANAPVPSVTYADADARRVVFKIKAAVRAARIRLSEFLRDGDKLKRGHITAHQLEAGLSAAGVQLSPPEHAAVAAAYTNRGVLDAGGHPTVKWMQLVEDVEAVFGAVPGLEQNPDFEVDAAAAAATQTTASLDGIPGNLRDSSRLSAAGASSIGLARHGDEEFDAAGGRRLSHSEESELRAVLRAVERFVAAKRLNMKPVFLDFDKSKRGYLPFNQFARALATMGIPISHPQRQLVGKAFATPASDVLEVSYRWFMAAVDPRAAEQMSATSVPYERSHLTSDSALDALLSIGRDERPRLSSAQAALGMGAAATGSGGGGMDASAPDMHASLSPSLRLAAPPHHSQLPAIEEVLRHLKETCITRGIRLVEHLRDFDPLRRGHISMAKFASAAKSANIHLSQGQLARLHADFVWAGDRAFIDYKPLVLLVDDGQEGLEKQPDASLPVFEVTRDVGGEGQLSHDGAAVVAAVRSKVRGQRMDLKSRFKEFDRMRHGVVNRTKFEMILNTEPGLKMLPRDIAVLAKEFASRRGADLVHYTAFLSHVEYQETR